MLSFRRGLAALAALSLVCGPALSAPKRAVVVSAGAIRPLPAGDTLQVNPASAAGASINLPHGSAPTSPADGDCWTTVAGLFCRIAGATVGPYGGASEATGTVTSVAVSGGSTGLSTSGGPVTGAGTIVLAGTLELDHGGTGATTAAGARSALGLGSLATQSGTFSGTSSGSNTGDQDLSGYATTTAVTSMLGSYATSAAVAGGYQPLAAVLTGTTASFTTAKDTKLSGIATGATANSADATLLARANHTGTQTAATISDFNTAADARVTAGLSGYATTAAVAAGYQPLDADLTAIASLSTTAFGRGLLDDADAAAARTSLGLGTAATSAASAFQAADADLTTFAAISPSANVQTLLGAADYAAFRTSLGAAPLASPTFTGTVTAPIQNLSTGLIIGTEVGGFVTSGAHRAQINATGTQTPLLITGGSGAIEIWSDSTVPPSAAVSFGMAVPALAGTSDFVFARYSGGWTETARIVSTTKGLTVQGPISGSNLSGTNTGDQTSVSGNAGTATALATGRTISITGKAASAGGTFDGTGNLALNVTALTVDGAIVPSSVASTGAITSSSPSAGVGYATGAGCAVTQATSKATAVTCNGRTGNITLNSASLAAATIVTFVLNDSAVSAEDLILASHHATGTFGAYTINCRVTGAGAASCAVRNNSAGALVEAIVIKFAVIEGVTS